MGSHKPVRKSSLDPFTHQIDAPDVVSSTVEAQDYINALMKGNGQQLSIMEDGMPWKRKSRIRVRYVRDGAICFVSSNSDFHLIERLHGL